MPGMAKWLERLAQPAEAFREARRVLKPGGRFLVKTPSRRHYVPLIARMTPHRFHSEINALRGRKSEDTFPTLYRGDNPAALRATAGASGLRLDRIRLVEGRPEYLRMTALTYLVGLAYERLVNATEPLAPPRRADS